MDTYVIVDWARGKRSPILETADWYLDTEELDRMITPKTKMFILNTPHNPTGKSFDVTELEEIASVLEKHPQVMIVTGRRGVLSFLDAISKICLMPKLCRRSL